VHVGLTYMNFQVCSYPESAASIAQLAEAAGFESLWAGEHIVFSEPQPPFAFIAPDERILDPLIALTFLAAHTRRVHLGTGLIILAQHNPFVLAKALASLDALSGGRVIFGIGVGYWEPEFRVLGVPFADRGARTNDYLAAMRAIWTQPQAAHHGRFVSFEQVQAHPQPQQAIPVVVGGSSPAAQRRAVEQAHGWYGWGLDVNRTTQALGDLAEALKRYNRPPELGKLEINISPPGAADITLELARQYADLGVDRLIIHPPRQFGQSVAALSGFVSQIGETVLSRI